MYKSALLIAIAFLIASPTFAAAHHGAPSTHGGPAAHVTLRRATAIALRAFPGRVQQHELEREAGGSGLRYSFVIRNGRVLHEVGVDAVTGDVLENIVEGPNAD